MSSETKPPAAHTIHSRQGPAWQVRFVVVDIRACTCERRDLPRSPGGLRALAASHQLLRSSHELRKEASPTPHHSQPAGGRMAGARSLRPPRFARVLSGAGARSPAISRRSVSSGSLLQLQGSLHMHRKEPSSASHWSQQVWRHMAGAHSSRLLYALSVRERDIPRSHGSLRALAAFYQLPGKLILAQEGSSLPLTAFSQHFGRCITCWWPLTYMGHHTHSTHGTGYSHR